MVDETDNTGERQAGRIEGGIDAIVIGTDVDGLAAASYLGKAGLRTVLVGAGAEIGGAIATRELSAENASEGAEPVSVVDGDHLVTMLDPDVIAELDLYRHGLEYAARRLDTTYFFDKGDALRFDGDLLQAAHLSLEEDDDRDTFEGLISELLEVAAYLRPAFKPVVFSDGDSHGARGLEKALAQATPEMSARIHRFLIASARDVVNATFSDGPLKNLLFAEAAFRAGVPPHEAFSFMHLVRRLAGETSGLQAAAAYPVGGTMAVVSALRRAAQAAKVEMRVSKPVKSILIEGDRVAGVMLEDGGQLRAPLLIASNSAPHVFLNLIGGASIDIELQRLLSAQRAEYSSARMHLVLKGVAQDDATKENLARRLLFVPQMEDVSAAFMASREGAIPQTLIVEALFPSALDPGPGLENRQLMSVVAHPLPFDEAPDEARRAAIRKVILANVERVIPDLAERVEIADLRLPDDDAKLVGAPASAFAAKPDILRQWALASAVAAGGRIEGFYFCGPEAQIGTGISCSSARATAKAALRAYKRSAL